MTGILAWEQGLGWHDRKASEHHAVCHSFLHPECCIGATGGITPLCLLVFTYQFTVLPVLMVVLLFLVLGILAHLLMYRSVTRCTIVERLRKIEN